MSAKRDCDRAGHFLIKGTHADLLSSPSLGDDVDASYALKEG